ncbi:hypothetical protein LCGC14_2530070 [marine sediment metagenome]|uniref:Uncharacterized protein n=1 Tax=marine sediment metagenome TaxID=412755 RepID=A0A0F9ATT8_9ZZZZ
MSAKQLMPNQHVPLHFLYGRNDCCLCNHQIQLKIERQKNKQLQKALKKTLPYAEGYDPAEYGGEEPTQEADIKFARDILEEK